MLMLLYSLKPNLKIARKKMGLTQQDLADAMEVSLKTVMNWEQGRVTPRDLETITHLADLLHCDVDYLIGRIECTTHDLQSIHKMTGLSEGALSKLMEWNNANDRSGLWGSYLSQMIENGRFSEMMGSFSDTVAWAKVWRKSWDAREQYDMDEAIDRFKANQFQLAKSISIIAEETSDRVSENEIRR